MGTIPLVTVSTPKRLSKYIFDIVYVMDNCKLCVFVMYQIKAEFIYLFMINNEIQYNEWKF